MIMLYPASTKWRLMILSAGTPMDSIFSDALKSADRRNEGHARKTMHPAAMIDMAMATLNFIVCVMRRCRRAP